LTWRSIHSFLVLQEVFEDVDFLLVSSARRLMKISGTVRAIELKFLQAQYMGLLHMHISLLVYYSATTTMVVETGTK
jgi:hypothetical protein